MMINCDFNMDINTVYYHMNSFTLFYIYCINSKYIHYTIVKEKKGKNDIKNKIKLHKLLYL